MSHWTQILKRLNECERLAASLWDRILATRPAIHCIQVYKSESSVSEVSCISVRSYPRWQLSLTLPTFQAERILTQNHPTSCIWPFLCEFIPSRVNSLPGSKVGCAIFYHWKVQWSLLGDFIALQMLDASLALFTSQVPHLTGRASFSEPRNRKGLRAVHASPKSGLGNIFIPFVRRGTHGL